MKAYDCVCGNTLFFDSIRCVKCGLETGLCPECQQVTAMESRKPDGLVCSNSECRTSVRRCVNFPEHGCNRLLPEGNDNSSGLCDYCSLTTIVPDLTVEGNRAKWKRLEQAKRRVLYVLDAMGLEFRPGVRQRGPSLCFEFRADGAEKVTTGHNDGCIVINIREADDLEREKARVEFGEPQRTLVGHFRHELGHFFWDCLIKNGGESDFREIFGDETSPSYADAMQQYYAQGPKADWPKAFVSAYASSHPWEDFAETFGTYLDMVTVLQTADHFGISPLKGQHQDLNAVLAAYRQLGIAVNELNRDMGLQDLVPEIFTVPVQKKLVFIHQLIQAESDLRTALESKVSEKQLN